MLDAKPSRYRFYQVHKFVSFEFSELERIIAKADFRLNADIENVLHRFTGLENMMIGHAAFEDQAIHELLRQKGSTVHEAIEAEHQEHHDQYQQLKQQIADILSTSDVREREYKGYAFYLDYRLFVSENLRHLHAEETIILPELHRLYTDEELKKVQANTYGRMTAEQMTHMIDVLTPHINPTDRAFFLNEMKDAEPEKFSLAGLDLVMPAKAGIHL